MSPEGPFGDFARGKGAARRGAVTTIAAVCKRGHVIDLESRPSTREPYCPECGERVVRECEACSSPIPGLPIDTADAWGRLDWSEWQLPRFRPSCGAAYPWLDRQGRIYELQNLLRHERVDEATALAIHEELDALTPADLPEKEQVRRWKRVKELAPPGMWERGANVIQDLATEYVKRKIGLPG